MTFAIFSQPEFQLSVRQFQSSVCLGAQVTVTSGPWGRSVVKQPFDSDQQQCIDSAIFIANHLKDQDEFNRVRQPTTHTHTHTHTHTNTHTHIGTNLTQPHFYSKRD